MDCTPHRLQFRSPVDADRLAAVQFASQRPDRCGPLAIALTTAAGDRNDAVAMLAAEALEMLGPPPRDTLWELIDLLQASGDGEVAYWSATLLGRLGPEAAPATAALTAALAESPFLPVRERAAWALSRIGRAASSAAPALRTAADDGPPRLRRLANQALESVRGMAA